MRRPRPPRTDQLHAARRAASRNLGAHVPGRRAAHDDGRRSGTDRARARCARGLLRRRRQPRPVFRRPRRSPARAAGAPQSQQAMTLPMPLTSADPRSHPLIARLVAREGFVEVDGANFDEFSAREGHVLLVFTEDPVRYKETLDLAVIVPEIERAFPGAFAVGILLPEAARKIAVRYGFRRWPALVLL